MLKRIVVAAALFLLPLTATAQMNDFGVFISTSQFESSEIEEAGDIFDVDFEEEMGVGILYNRFWTSSFSTEFAYQRVGADLTLSFEDVASDVAELDLDILSATAQLHFARGSMISPYIGGGAAYISGEAGSIDEDEFEAADLENEIELLANAGLNVGLGRSFVVFLDGKYILYEARGEGDADDDAIEINPLIISAGIKWRF
ncbi:MAG TPA: OmpW family outer membrane protein [Thermoanaerobaculia bacterium]|nr:OmpW family outer membrane protein [Thermoanaerobaculia bacterium]